MPLARFAKHSVRNASVPRTILVAQMVTVLIVVGLVVSVAYIAVRAHNIDMAGDRASSTARTASDASSVIDALESDDPSTTLQPYTVDLADDAGLDFVTVFGPDGTRYTHTDRSSIGEKMGYDFSRVLDGQTYAQEFDGSRGRSVRALAPVKSDSGEIIGIVVAGITVQNVNAILQGRMFWIVLLGLALFAIGAFIAWLVSRRIRRVTGDYGAQDLARVFSYYQSALRSVREGLLLVEPSNGIVLRNDEATRLLGLPADDGRPLKLGDVDLPDTLEELLVSGRQASDEIHLTATRVIVVNQQSAATPRGMGPVEPIGTVVTLRDHTELQALVGELDSVKSFAESLRSQSHEFANRLHTMVSLIELGRGDEAIEFATEELSAPQALTDRMLAGVDQPVVTALLLAKSAKAAERGIDFDLQLQDLDNDRLPQPRELVTVIGNLLDNAFDAVAEQDACEDGVRRTVRLTIGNNSVGLFLRVEDSGPGIPGDSADDVFRRGWTTKGTSESFSQPHGLGLGLVDQAVRRLGGTIEVGRAGDGLTGAAFAVSIPAPDFDDAAPAGQASGR